jgi:hypothetical protein
MRMIAKIGGRLKISSSAATGTEVQLSVPKRYCISTLITDLRVLARIPLISVPTLVKSS